MSISPLMTPDQSRRRRDLARQRRRRRRAIGLGAFALTALVAVAVVAALSKSSDPSSRAASNEVSAEKAWPLCRSPVGDGAKRAALIERERP